ncbi:flagellar protein FliT [Cohnella pontilimi]|uniref:Flagellar protein FliT n=1 Tax=Cohnella pontilimi TaxID=2564100 RepID=A0A4U0FAX4_9BACL|nr:flagellar protein FliT [Cohnella pontilimi]TJY41956.1 flagellar protein FliT [Cohnella pontilimi]
MDELLKLVLAESQSLGTLDASADYERYEKLVDLRQSLTEAIELASGVTPEQKKMIQEILRNDAVILQHMQSLKDQAAEGLTLLQAAKKQKSAYQLTDYSDSFMFDRKQ